MRRVIKCTLDVSSIEDAIKQLQLTSDEVIRKMDEVGRRLTAEGVDIAKANIASFDAIDTGQLMSSIRGEYDESTHTGRVWTDGCPYAAFVEFGTGIVGLGQPHPEPIDWAYDINDHGDAGWYYPKNGEYWWTKGQPAKPFMYLTGVALEERCLSVAEEVFK